MDELKANFDRYVEVSNRIDALKDCEIKLLKGTIRLMEKLLNNKEK
jgi:hypothetical protein